MKRTAMLCKTPMRRGPRDQPAEVAESVPATVRRAPALTRRAVMAPSNDAVFAQPKENAIQHEGYMRLVRLLPCANCGIEGYTQFCHADQGKGMALKTDCRRGWPGCGPRPGVPGCHYLIGTS